MDTQNHRRETGKQNTYLIRINRAGADLALDYIRVNNANAIFDPATGRYFAYVPRFIESYKRPNVTAKAKNREGFTTVWNTLNGTNTATGTMGAEVKLNEVDPLQSEVLPGNDTTPMQVMIFMETVTTSTEPYDASKVQPETILPSETDEDESLIERDASGNVLVNHHVGIVTRTTLKREIGRAHV